MRYFAVCDYLLRDVIAFPQIDSISTFFELNFTLRKLKKCFRRIVRFFVKFQNLFSPPLTVKENSESKNNLSISRKKIMKNSGTFQTIATHTNEQHTHKHKYMLTHARTHTPTDRTFSRKLRKVSPLSNEKK